jgi:hypothetical protein
MSFHRRYRNQGESVSNAEHTAKDPSNRIGLFAVLSDLLRDGGTRHLTPRARATDDAPGTLRISTSSVAARALPLSPPCVLEAAWPVTPPISRDRGVRRRGAPSSGVGVGGRTSSLRLLAPLALAFAALLALFDGRRRPRAAKHQSDGGGQQLVTSTCLDSPAQRHVLGRPDSSTIGTPCVLPLLGPALAVPALGGPESPPTAVTATAKAKRLKGNSKGLAVDNEDNGYVADTATRTLDKFDSAVLA